MRVQTLKIELLIEINLIKSNLFLGLARKLMDGLEVISDKKKCYFVDLFVRKQHTRSFLFVFRMNFLYLACLSVCQGVCIQ